ncbi:GyrI-like domain-containing protein, partial [Bacteroides ovatus]|uniref:GyrI-like domain-containing protein n=1 Tax=Bacteroides ovatus TaxID=28116 RepID=UPI001E63D468
CLKIQKRQLTRNELVALNFIILGISLAIQKGIGTNPPLTSPIKHMDLPQGTYAVYVHQGDYALLDAFYETILKQLPQFYSLGETPILEHYLNSPTDTDVKELLTEVWIPIVK